MAHLRTASRNHIEEVYAETHAMWGGGLRMADYLGLWEDLHASSWGKDYTRFLVWIGEDGELLSSMKLYRPKVRWFDRTCRAAVAGAIFTPERLRRQGHAAAMIDAMLEQAGRRGDEPALLFSDVGTGYYGKLGYEPLPAEECWGMISLDTDPPASSYEIVPAAGPHMEPIFMARDAMTAGARFAVVREPEHWRYLLMRAGSFFRRLGDDSMSHRFLAVLRKGRFAGYVITVEGRGYWNIREAGAVDADPDLVAQVLRVAAASAAKRGNRKIHCWLPRKVTDRLPEWRTFRERRKSAIPMVRPLQGAVDLRLLRPRGAVELMFMDQF
jgi:hypothetical protein